MNITIYSKSGCPNCVTAKQLLNSKGIEYMEINIDTWSDEMCEAFMARHPQARQMPQIFVNDVRIGGLAGLQTYLPQILDTIG